MSDLYEADILTWSEQQAALLRRLADGERVNDRIDWENVVEEVESVGRSELRAVKSLLTNALVHDLKLRSWPNSSSAGGWRREMRVFLRQAKRDLSPSMRRKIDLAELYADALDLQPETIDGQAPLPVPETCPVTLDELLGED